MTMATPLSMHSSTMCCSSSSLLSREEQEEGGRERRRCITGQTLSPHTSRPSTLQYNVMRDISSYTTGIQLYKPISACITTHNIIITQPDSSWTKYCVEHQHTHLSQQNAWTYATHPCSSSRILLALCRSWVNISGDLSMIWRASMAAEDIMGGIEAEKQ